MRNLTLNKKLALIALVLGLVAVFLGNPYRGNTVSMSTEELGLIIQKEVDHVYSQDLADWIIQGKSDFRVIDLRTEKEYEEYHIPGAERITLTELEKADIPKNEKLIIYSEGGIHSAQAWMLLKARGYKGVYMLMGGLEEWKDKILFPRLPDNATPEQVVEFGKTREVSKFFGGTPVVGGSEETKTETPKLEMPKIQSPSGTTPTGTAPKKKKEGC